MEVRINIKHSGVLSVYFATVFEILPPIILLSISMNHLIKTLEQINIKASLTILCYFPKCSPIKFLATTLREENASFIDIPRR